MNNRPKILIVDDEPFNVDYLEQELEDLGYDTIRAANGQQALAQVKAESPDLVLLDIMMPILDGFEVLTHLKADKATRDIPVIIISALNDLSSVVRGIQLGAEDCLPKPFDPVLLQARLSASLDKKRYRDQEVEYLRQVERLTDAAQAVEGTTFDPDGLSPVAQRPDALGHLARIFQRMAREVHAREQRLKQQLQQMVLDLEERQKASAETVVVYIPMDRRYALANGQSLPDRTRGAALLADISGFTPLTEALAQELGLQRGAEELTRQLNRVFGALIDEVHRYGGSVIGFGGDAITCWFDADSGMRAVAAALAMQAAMHPFATLTTPAGTSISVAIKVAVVAGPVRRFLVGDPHFQQMDVLAGHTLEELAAGEQHAHRGEVLVQAAIVDQAAGRLQVADWRNGRHFAVVTRITGDVAVAECPWPPLASEAITAEQAQPWLLPAVYERVRGGKSEFLSELRPAAALFLKFTGIDYDHDDNAGAKLDSFLRWVQAALDKYDATPLQLTIGDKGSYFYAAFGAPIAHTDDAVRAVRAALELQTPPAHLPFITHIQIGLAYGQMRAGAYGSAAQRTYGVLGDKTNLAARLMLSTGEGILCDEAIYQAAQATLNFEPLPPITVKGKGAPIAVYRPTGESDRAGRAAVSLVGRTVERALLIDRLDPEDQLTLKVASVIGRLFTLDLLRDIYPVEGDKAGLPEHLQTLEDLDLIASYGDADSADGVAYSFRDPVTHETAYNLMLFAQRRQLHRAVAEWHERTYADLSPYYPLLAHHWVKAEDAAKAIYYLEKAGEQARQNGVFQDAVRYFNESLNLEAQGAILSADYYSVDGSDPHSSIESG